MVINGTTINPEQYYSPEEAAQVLGVKTATLASWRCRPGTLPFTKLGRRVRYRGADLVALISDGAKEPGADPVRSAAARERAIVRERAKREAA